MEKQKEYQATWINSWYRESITMLMRSFTELCETKDVDVPDYFPGRHWLSELKDLWQKLFPDSDSSTYEQLCEDVSTVLGIDLFFFDLKSRNIEKLHDYLINNYETTRTTLARIATNMKELDVVDYILQSEKGEMPNDDGLVVYYHGRHNRKPSCIYYMSGPETEFKLKWSQILPERVAHCFNPYIDSQSNKVIG